MKINNRPKVKKFIIESLENGNGIKKSCAAAGISYNTYLDWTETESPRHDSDFSNLVKKALLSGKQSLKEICQSVVFQAATAKEKPVWQAAAWILERRFPEDYGVRQAIEHSGEIKQTTDISQFTEEEKQVLLKIARKNEYQQK